MHGRLLVLTTNKKIDSYTVEEEVLRLCPSIDYIDENVLDDVDEIDCLFDFLESNGVKYDAEEMTIDSGFIAEFKLLDESFGTVEKTLDIVECHKFNYPVYNAGTGKFYESFLEFAYEKRAWRTKEDKTYTIVGLYDFHV